MTYANVPLELVPLVEAGYELMPLSPGRKKPAHTGWQKRDYSSFNFVLHRQRGGGIGIRLKPGHVVIDDDPRNHAEGDDPVKRLSEAIGFDLTTAPTTITGSGGRHFYLRLPDGVTVKNGSLAGLGYVGIDVKTIGGFVVAPGSLHPETGKPYRMLVEPGAIAVAPDSLVEMVRRPERSEGTPRPGVLDPDELAELLAVVDPADGYGKGRYDAFTTMCAACNDACPGGLTVFQEWAGRDPAYGSFEDDERIERMWHSFQPGREGGVTYRTLLHAVAEAGHRDLAERCRARIEFEEVPMDDEPVASKPPRFRRWTVAQLLALPMPNWLVDGMLLDTSLGLLFGRWKTYKTFCAIDIALHIATGRPWYGRSVTQTNVTYVIGEGSKRMFGNRVAAWCKTHNVDPADLDAWFQVVPVRVPLDNASHDGGVQEYIRTDPASCGLTVFDTLARNMEGDESSNQDMGKAVRGADDIREHYGGAVLLVHHTGHEGDRARGASALLGAVDVEIRAAPREEHPGQVTLWIRELREGQSGAEFYFEPVVVPLGFEPPTASVVMRFIGSGVHGDESEKEAAKKQAATSDLLGLLITIHEHPNASQRDLGKMVGKSQSTINTWIGKLRERGWVDASGKMVTEEGQSRLQEDDGVRDGEPNTTERG